MTIHDLQAWLEAHAEDITTFMDYEASIQSDEELSTTLGYWFDTENWKIAGHRFVSLGHDGAGGQFAAWLRQGDDGPPPVVFFGSEGGRGVVARSFEDWPKVVAHAPGIDEYTDDLGPTRLDPESNFILYDEEEDAPEAREALARYRTAVLDRFGPLPPMDELTAGLETLNLEFTTWIEQCLAGKVP